MSKIFLLITMFFVSVLLVSTVSATNWYVDNQATGTGSGVNWANAATAVHRLPWSSVNAGDTVHISGGSVSKTYSKDYINNKKVTGGIVTVTKGKDAGHNGDVIFQQTSPVAVNGWERYTFSVHSSENIKLTGLTFITAVNDDEEGRFIVGFSNGFNNWIDNCHVISNGNGVPVYFDHETKLKITNNILETLPNTFLWGQDIINGGGGGGGHTITGNILIGRGSVYSDYAHKDMIQMGGGEGLSNNYVMTIANNFFYYNVPVVPLSAVLYLAGIGSGRLLIYNNIIVTNLNGVAAIVAYPTPTTYNLSAKIFNNVIIDSGVTGGHDMIVVGDLSSLAVKNNIAVYNAVTSGNQNFITFIQDGRGYIKSIDIDYNHYYRINGVSNKFAGYTWTQWQGLGYDLHGNVGLVNFANILGSAKQDYRLLEGSLGIDAGTSITDFNADIFGTSRPQGTAWDIGAYEYVSDGVTYHPADLNSDGCVSLGEISSYVGRWLNGQITLGTVSSGVSKWLGGC